MLQALIHEFLHGGPLLFAPVQPHAEGEYGVAAGVLLNVFHLADFHVLGVGRLRDTAVHEFWSVGESHHYPARVGKPRNHRAGGDEACYGDSNDFFLFHIH